MISVFSNRFPLYIQSMIFKKESIWNFCKRLTFSITNVYISMNHLKGFFVHACISLCVHATLLFEIALFEERFIFTNLFISPCIRAEGMITLMAISLLKIIVSEGQNPEDMSKKRSALLSERSCRSRENKLH